MKQQCDNCGEIEAVGFTFSRDGCSGAALNYTQKFCYSCGFALEEIIKAGWKKKT